MTGTRMRSDRGGARVGALLMLSLCFVAAAIVRAGGLFAALPAMAADDGFGRPMPTAAATIAKEPEAPMAIRAPEEVIAELRQQRQALEEREARIVAREQTLAALQVKLRGRLEEMKAARARLAETAALVDDAAAKDVRRLSEMYQQMKPKQAAQIFNQMAPSFASGFIGQMRPDAAALIMANMEAEKAYAVSLLLAGRNVGRDARDSAGVVAEPNSAETVSD